MAVFLVNQCAFTKAPQFNNDQQNPSAPNFIGANPQNNQNSNDSSTNLNPNGVGVGVGHLASPNICGLKFDSLFELIHHIEDNHINEMDYQIPPPREPNNPPGMAHHVTQIINGGWLPTSCVLRIFNSTQKPPNKQIQMQQHQQLAQPHPQLLHKIQQGPPHHLHPLQAQSQIKYEPGHVMNPSQDLQQQTTIVIPSPLAANHMQQQMTPTMVQSPMQQQQAMMPQQMIAVQQQQPTQMHQIPVQTQPQQMTVDMMSGSMLASPKAVGTINGGPYINITTGTIATTQPNVIGLSPAATPVTQLQQAPQNQQIMNSGNSANQATNQNSLSNSIQIRQAGGQPSPAVTPKPTKVFKCSDCSKTYKTPHGLRTHQLTHYPNSPTTDGKVITVVTSDGRDSASGTGPVSVSQQQSQAQTPQPLQQTQLQSHQQHPMSVEVMPSPKPIGNLNGGSFHVTTGAIATSQANVIGIAPSVTNVSQIQPQQTQSNQQTSVNNNSSNQTSQSISNSIQTQQTGSQTPAVTPKPTKVFKCSDCSKTYKTPHGLRTHQTTHHPNSPVNDGKVMAIMSDSRDNSSGSASAPAGQLTQQQPQTQLQPQQQPQQPTSQITSPQAQTQASSIAGQHQTQASQQQHQQMSVEIVLPANQMN